MDINDLRGFSTALLLFAFLGMVVWAWSKKRKQTFDEAANLPFADEEMNQRTLQEEARNE